MVGCGPLESRRRAAEIGDLTTWSPVVELRQYTLHPGRRDVLIDIFDREFVETQEAAGMKVIAQFRSLDDPDRFVWVRGFPDMPSRKRSLEAFYTGPVWAEHGPAANATMIDSDDVLLLRPARPDLGFVLGDERPPPGSTEIPDGIVVVTIHCLEDVDPDEYAVTLESALDSGAASLLALFVTEPSSNTFPQLPVREDARVVVAFQAFADDAAYRESDAAHAQTPGAKGIERVQVLRLRATARSHTPQPVRGHGPRS
jgi:NIPSNAP